MKTLHKLKEKESLFNDFYVFDTETKGLRAKSDAFVFGVVYGWNYIKVIYTVKDFQKEFLKPRYKNKKVFAHNLEYDGGVIYDNIYDVDNKAIFNNRLICFTNGNCLFADSVNIYPTSVKKLGEIINLEKLEIEDKYKEGSEIKEVTQKMIDYCIRDCEIVYKALYEIFVKVGSIKITIAGLAMDFFRRKHQPFNIDYNEKFGNYFHLSYYGGRTECFKIGKTKAVCYDINSMYPWAMKYTYFPNPRNLSIRIGVPVKSFINHYLKYYEGVAEVELFHVEHYFGFLPFRHDGKLLFPTGNLKGFWNFNELRYAIEKGIISIKHVKRIIYAQRMKSPFIKYVDELYNEKSSAQSELEKEVAKKLLNSLYGKFAQRINTENIYISNIDTEYETIKEYARKKKLLKIIPFNNERKDCFITVKSNRGYMYHSIPLFSSYITSASRIYLLDFLLKYQNKIPVYCDTDSIFFEIDPNIKGTNELGDWKKEDKTVVEIRGLKNYSYLSNGKRLDKIKGVKKTAVKIGDGYHYKSLVRTKEALRRNIEPGIEIEREKILKLTYDKRKVLKNGTTTTINF